jgi:hypothetical protein
VSEIADGNRSVALAAEPQLRHPGEIMRTIHARVVFGGVVIVTILHAGIPSAGIAVAALPSHNCIAIVMPVVQGVPGNALDAASGVRDLIAGYLSGPKSKVIALEARLQSQAIDEAKEKGCEPLLFVTVTHKSGGKGFLKALGKGAGASSFYVPGGGTVAAVAARAATAAGLQTASSLAASTKARDQIRLEYRLQSATGQIELGPKTEEQTAKVDGEDLLTPVVSRAAEAIVARMGAN